MRLLILFAWCSLISATEARIGETSIQFVDRYGAPKDTSLTKITDKTSPLIEGAIHHTYEYQGWRIRAAFLQLDGPAIRMDYSKRGPDIAIKDYEVEAIMAANKPTGTKWAVIAYDNPDLPNKGLDRLSQALAGGMMGEKMWRRTDGAILWLRSHLIVRLELPAAREYEQQLELSKEQKAKASVPRF